MKAFFGKLLVSSVFWSTPCLWAMDLKVKVQGNKGDEGQYLVAVYSDAESFLNAKKAVKEAVIKVNDAKDGITLTDLPVGTYALAVIHDKNANGNLDTNFLGIPKEPFGTSQNAPSRFGPPSFEQSKFELKEGLVLPIELREY